MRYEGRLISRISLSGGLLLGKESEREAPHGKLGKRAGLLLVRLEVFFLGAADRALPVVRNLLERGSRVDAAIGIPDRRVIDPAANLAYVLLHDVLAFITSSVAGSRRLPPVQFVAGIQSSAGDIAMGRTSTS